MGLVSWRWAIAREVPEDLAPKSHTVVQAVPSTSSTRRLGITLPVLAMSLADRGRLGRSLSANKACGTA